MTQRDTPLTSEDRHSEGGRPVERKRDSAVDDDQREPDDDTPQGDAEHDRDERVSLYPLSPEEALRALLNTPNRPDRR